jgi:hypothetical protein
MSYILGRWCHIIVLKAQAPTEDKIDGAKSSVYKGLEHDENFVRTFQCQEDIFKPTI